MSTSNGGTGATLVWRRGGRTYLTAIVKATFALVPGGVMTPVKAEPIAPDEQEYAAGLRSAGDLVPFRTQADVLLTGHAFAPAGPIDASVPVRFTVSRDGAAVLDKSLSLQVAAGAPAGLVRLAGLGPLSRRWPIRSRLLGAHDPRLFEGSTIDLPPVFDESYFQAAPIDQRLDGLRGDEHVAFEGARPEGARIETRLPGARVVARLHGPSVGFGNERPVQLVIDTLHVDLDKWVCNVTWRGVTPVPREDDLASTHLSATLEFSSLSLPPPARLVEPAPPMPPSPQTAPWIPGELQGALAGLDAQLIELEEDEPFESTLCLSPEEAASALAGPLRSSPPPAAPAAPQLASPPSVPLSDFLRSRFRPAESGPPPPPPQAAPAGAPQPIEQATAHPLQSTRQLSHAEMDQLRALPSTPFGSAARSGPPPAAALEPAAAPPRLSQRQSFSEEEEEPTLEVVPSRRGPAWLGPRAVAVSAVSAVSREGMTFGAHFLAEMALLDDGTGDQG